MSIYFFETTAQEREYIAAQLPGEELVFSDAPLTTAEQAKAISHNAEVVSVFVHSHVGPEVIDELTKLKLVVT